MFQHREKQFQTVYIHASLVIRNINFKQCSGSGSGLDPDSSIGSANPDHESGRSKLAPQKRKEGFKYMFEESYVTVLGQKIFPIISFFTNFVIINHDPDLDPYSATG
jgi:hypothetical protein